MKTKLREFVNKNRYTTILFGLLAVVLVFFTIMKGGRFWQPNLWKGMLMQFPEYGCMTLGLMFVFICGKHDMSAVMLGNFASIIAVQYMSANVTETMTNGQVGGVMLVAILFAVAIAVVGGIINALLVSRLNIPPVMATIAMQLVWKGFSTALTKGYAVKGLPALYTEIGHMELFGFLPVPLLVFIVLFAIAAFLLKCTVYGEKLYMVGNNQKAAHFSAINTNRMITITYILSAVYSVIGVLLMVSTMGSAKADYGTSYITRAILILVLAGCLPDGGMGKISDILIALVTIQIIATGVNLFPKLNTYYASLIWGGLLIVVLIMSTKMTNFAPKAKKIKAPKKTPEKAA